MGQTLTEPSTEKETSSFENDLFLVGVSSMQGWRTGILSCLMPSLHQHPMSVGLSVCLSIHHSMLCTHIKTYDQVLIP